MHNFTAAIMKGNYMFWLQSSYHKAVYVISIQGNHIPVVYLQLQMISGGYLGLTYKGVRLLYVNNHLQYKTIVQI